MQEPVYRGYEWLNYLSTGIFVCEPETLVIRFANELAENWFGSSLAGRPLSTVMASIVPEEVTERLAKGRSFSVSGEVEPPQGRTVPYRVSIRPKKFGPEELLLAEVENISRLKEREYLLESYASIIERKNREIEKEQERADKLLMNVFPYKVLQEFKEFGTTTPSFFDEVSVMFLDFVGFTKMPVSKQPMQLIAELNDIFSTFDQIVEHHCCERIKTIGDAYLAVAGMPSANPDHALDITNAAIKIIGYLKRRNLTHPISWTCRIGIHTGSVVGSVVGIRKYIYDVFGDGVNTASRMQSLSEPMRITVSEPTYQIIKGAIPCLDRGANEIKGAKRMNIYFVDMPEAATDGSGTASSQSSEA